MPFNQSGPSSQAHFAGTYNDIAGNQTNNVYNIDTSTTLSRLKATLNPSHLPGDDRPTCLRGTRTNIQDQISEFIDKESCESNVVFLLGRAGTGKSTIATTIANDYYEKRRLGCHLFFLRGRSDPNTVIRTIAYNLAAFNSSIALSIENALQSRGDLTSITLRTQFNILIREPLLLAASHVKYPVLIVLDAIDECGTSQTRHTLLHVLGEGLNDLPSKFRFLITGRSENDIVIFSDSLNAYTVNLNDIPDDNKKDVCTYIKHEFGLWRKSVKLPGDWPWDDNMARLGKAADGLFIWASTAVKYVLEGKLNRIARLNRLVTNAKVLDLNELYVTVLEASLEWDEDTSALFSSVFSLIFFGKSPLSEEVIDGILGVEPGTASELLSCLRSLVSYEFGQPVKIHHTSFYDYLVSCKGKGWYIDIESQKRSITASCLNKMNYSLRFNICNIKSSFLLNEDVSDLQERIEKQIPKHLQYICSFWAHHLRETSYTDVLGHLLKTFAYNKLLFWFEVLSLTDAFDDYVGTALGYAISWLGNNNPELSTFLRDAYRQATVFSEAISNSAPHIYCSLLPLTKDKSTISSHYKDYANPVAHVEYTGNRQQSAVIKVIKSDGGGLRKLLFSPDGTRIVSASEDGIAYIWDAASGKLIATLNYMANEVTFSPNGDLVALALYKKTSKRRLGEEPEEGVGTIRVWSPMRGEIVQELSTDTTDRVTSIVFSKSGKYIASGCQSGRILIWDVESGKVDGKPQEGHTERVKSVSFSYDDQHLVSGSDDETIVMWNVQSRTMVYAPLKGHTNQVNTVEFSPTTEYFLSASSDYTIRIWEKSTGQEIHRLEGCTHASYTSDGLQILGFGDAWSMIEIWNVLNIDGPPKQIRIGHRCWSVAFAPDGTRFASSSGTKIEIWDSTVNVVDSEQTHKRSNITSSAVSPSGRYIASGDWDGMVCVWYIVTGKLVSGPRRGHNHRVMSVAFSSDEKFVASGSDDKTVRVWKALSGETVTVFRGHTDCITSVAFSPIGKHLASGSLDSTIRVWSVESRELALKPFRCHKGSVYSIAYSPDGTRIISGSSDRTVRIWDATDGQSLSVLEGHTAGVNSVAYSPGGLNIVSGSVDKTMLLWNIKSGKIESVMNHDATVNSICYSHDGTQIMSGSNDGSIRVWDSSARNLLLGPLVAHSQRVNSLSFFPDNKRFASGSDDKTIRIWSLGDVDWDLRREDGWIVDKNNNLLMWFPKEAHETLITPRNHIIINALYETRLDFSLYLVGDEWTKSIAITSE